MILAFSGLASVLAALTNARNMGVSSILSRKQRPAAPSSSAIRKGTRQPQAIICCADRFAVKMAISRAPNSNPTADAAGSKLENKPRRPWGAYSLINKNSPPPTPPGGEVPHRRAVGPGRKDIRNSPRRAVGRKRPPRKWQRPRATPQSDPMEQKTPRRESLRHRHKRHSRTIRQNDR